MCWCNIKSNIIDASIYSVKVAVGREKLLYYGSSLGLILDKKPEVQMHSQVCLIFQYHRSFCNLYPLAYPDLLPRSMSVPHSHFPFHQTLIIYSYSFLPILGFFFFTAPVTVVSEQFIFSTVLIHTIPKCNCMRSKGSTIIPIL